MTKNLRIRELINRLARVDTAQRWHGDLNPAQSAVLDYLNRANRFSRSPSHVADYLGTTRGTVSQSLKSLSQKGYVSEHRSMFDKRTISFDLTEKGLTAVVQANPMAHALEQIDAHASANMLAALEMLFATLLKENGGRAFGVCKGCTHFSRRKDGGHCTLLSEDLSEPETMQICHEQVSA